MAARYVVLFSVMLLVMGGCHYYVWARLVRDTELPAVWARILATGLVVLLALLMSGFLAFRALPRAVAAPISWVTYTWLGVLFYLVVSLAFTDVLKAVATFVGEGLPGRAFAASSPGARLPDPDRRQAMARFFGAAAALLGLGASGVGLIEGLAPVGVTRVRVALERFGKAAGGFKIVQITDIHVGPTIGRHFIEDIVARVNALEPDVVAITGDLVDGSVEQLAEHVAPLAGLRAKHGVYFVTGNHEYYSGADAWIAHLRTLGVRVLRNERVSIGGEHGFDLAGIDDHSSGHYDGHGSDLPRALEGRDPSRAVVLLAHQPRGIELADELGVDLQLSGHTHGGQLFPWNVLVRLQQPFVAGLHRLSRAQIYVSRGTGYWGPPMRVAAPAEITEIELVPAGATSAPA